MSEKVYLLDGMALIYRAHFALIRSPIFNSKGENTSALFGFTNTLLDILENHGAAYVALAMDTPEPTERHKVYPAYKAQRDEVPEDILAAIPSIQDMARAFGVAVLRYPGYEADDVIGTYARLAEEAGLETFMVTPDKDFAQLVSARTRICKPAPRGDGMEVLDVEAVLKKWNVRETAQVADILGLWGDASDNIPGIPGYGEKTAKKLIGTYGTIENLIAHAEDLKGKQKERLVEHGEQALLSKQLATIDRFVPVTEAIEDLRVGPRDVEQLKQLFTRYEFNSLGRRVLGDGFKAGHGHEGPEPVQGDLFQGELALASLKTARDVPHDYEVIDDVDACRALVKRLEGVSAYCFDVETDGLDPKEATLLGVSFSCAAHQAAYVAMPGDGAGERLACLRPLFENEGITKVGHHLKFDISVLKWNGVEVKGPLFDTMVAHFLVEPDRRHNMDTLSEQYLGYTPIPISALLGEARSEQKSMQDVPLADLAEYAAEDADVTWQLHEVLKPLLEAGGQERVFFEIECPLIRVLVDMEHAGIRLDVSVLEQSAQELSAEIEALARRISELAGCTFNLNSPKQLGEVLFERLQLVEKAKKTKTGQYATNEQVLTALAPKHEIVRQILEYREATKLKSTYVDALPRSIAPRTGRVHTSFSQTGAATGRLASSDPNLQNIPIRSERGRRIRAAFVAGSDDVVLLSADYSQIELRVMAAMSEDEGMREAFLAGQDIHAATAARINDVDLESVDADMRRTAKMVNFGIIYGISAFGLAQRLGIARTEATSIIEHYFAEYPGVRAYMDRTVEFCRSHGYVETLTGRRRAIRDIGSANGTVRGAAERMAINAPIQGTAADMIKAAMNRIHGSLLDGGFRSRMLLQVHDELVLEVARDEEERVRTLVEEGMKNALPLSIPVVVDMGVGRSWLEAH